MDTQTRLRKLMQAHSLDTEGIAKLLGVSKHTVISWLRPRGTRAYRSMPQPMLRLLGLLLDGRRRLPD